MSSDLAPDNPIAWLRTALGSWDPVRSLEAIQAVQERLLVAEHEAVALMRLRGSSWQDTAAATGMNSRQAAQLRYATVDDLGELPETSGSKTPSTSSPVKPQK